jgi:hypothetical protein
MTIKRASTLPPVPVRRRDGGGHLNPVYADELRELGRDHTARDARPFFNQSFTEDAFAEQLGEQAVETATSGEDHALGGAADDNTPEDTVSPFRAAIMSPSEEEEEEEEE